MGDRERRDDSRQRTQAAERDHQASQEEQVIDAAKDVPEAFDREAQRGLMPTRVQDHEPGFAGQLIGPHDEIGRAHV